jgi:subtilase family serine protease
MERILRCVVSLSLLASTAWALQPDRIAGAIDGARTVVLKDSLPPRAQAQFDRGHVDPNMTLGYITLQFALSDAQQAALNKLLAEQQDPNSPNYHHWLTPEQYGARFGVSNTDLAKVKQWLQSQGFGIVEVARGRNWIAFNGEAQLAQQTFRTQLHRYQVDGEAFFANATEVSIPQALQGLVGGVRGLDNFKPKAMYVKGSANPDYTSGGGGHYLAPDDIATIFDIGPLYSANINGNGIKVAIMGQTDFHIADIQQFRTAFGLPKNDPTTILATGCTDPGYTGDEIEADLDLEWSGAVARNASIVYVNCNNVTTSFQYAINHNVAPVVSMSYGGCEINQMPKLYLTGTYQPLVQQGNAQGQTVMVSSDDSGAAGCDAGGSGSASGGLAVNGLASPPEVVAVGGTEFNEGSGTYWNASNGPNGGSAKSYIPELAWDDSSAGTGLSSGLWSSGGGVSVVFNRPAWQTGPGKFNSTMRSVPDIAMPASADHDGYLFCTGNGCSSGIGGAGVVGGTSASAPVFAGIVALLDQQNNSGGLGNINTVLYPLSQSVSNAFHDVPAGTYNFSGATANASGNMVPCASGKPNCPSNPPLQFGFLTGTGYDPITGLGSVDAYNLVTNWNAKGNTPSTTTLSLSSSNITMGTASVVLTAKVAPTSGNGTPTGSVIFFNGSTKIGTANLSSGKATFTYKTNALVVGSYSITGNYGGDGVFAGSNSSPSTLKVQDFSIAMGSSTVTVSTPGQGGSNTVTLTPGASGFNQTVTYLCSGLPAEASCTFTANTNGASVSISTTAASGKLHESPLRRSSETFFAMLLPGLLGLVSAGTRRRARRAGRVVGLMLVLGLLSVWLACGGGSSAPKDPGTPMGNSTVTVSASAGSLQHTAQFTLTVQ